SSCCRNRVRRARRSRRASGSCSSIDTPTHGLTAVVFDEDRLCAAFFHGEGQAQSGIIARGEAVLALVEQHGPRAVRRLEAQAFTLANDAEAIAADVVTAEIGLLLVVRERDVLHARLGQMQRGAREALFERRERNVAAAR